MSTLVKRILMGVVLGILVVFAVVGIKSTLKPNTPITSELQVVTQPPSSKPATTPTPTPSVPIANTEAPKAPIPDPNDPNAPTEPPSVLEPDPTQTAQQNPTAPVPNEPVTVPATPPAEAVPATAPPAPETLGKLRLVLVDPNDLTLKPKASFIVQDSQGVQVAMKQDTDVAIFDLPAGTYEASVSINGKRNTRTVTVEANRAALENFNLPRVNASAETPATPTSTEPTTTVNPEGTLQIIVKASGSGQPVNANVYVQKTNGVNVASKTYTPNAEFLLEPGKYKVTVKAKDRADLVQEITVSADKSTRATFNLQLVAPATPTLRPAPVPTQPTQRPITEDNVDLADRAKQIQEPDIPPLEDLPEPQIQDRPVNRDRPSRQEQEPGTVVDTVENPGDRAPGRNRQGTLELHAVSGVDGSPLAVDFTVTTLQGQVIDSFSEVSLAELALPAQDVVVNIDYRGMHGQETIRVTGGRPTVYTFTVTPNDQVNLNN